MRKSKIAQIFASLCLVIALGVGSGIPAAESNDVLRNFSGPSQRPEIVYSGVTEADKTPTWYMPWVDEPYAPTFEVLDISGSVGVVGRYSQFTKTITLKDIAKMHGHLSEGLGHGAAMMKLALDELYPDGIIDRTNTRVMTGPYPPFVDVACYLSGARFERGTHVIDKKLGHSIIVQRMDNKRAVIATWRSGISNFSEISAFSGGTDPGSKITWKPKVDTKEMLEIKKKIFQEFTITPYELDKFNWMQVQLVNEIFQHPLKESYQVKGLEDFVWPTPEEVKTNPDLVGVGNPLPLPKIIQ
jgi:hypothetical protein